ncbi:MAG: M28 family peptidase [candidate division KSB1 bacterium]|nr:M28 family peptidase [candidate division KSB1 bacterium]MDZ7318780.1 M28 family peptidase [candidate division KSB1 bacterium]MDZ7341476.1 M28 family peptidase [candidate division KSB1 bacterium]
MKLEHLSEKFSLIMQFRTIRKALHHHVDVLSNEFGPRNSQQYAALTRAATYIEQEMRRCAPDIIFQNFEFDNKTYSNLTFEKLGKTRSDEIIVIGAHYDTVVNSPGADDNASGIAGLLEICRLLQTYENRRTIRFVAFTLEEPPFFATDHMGSHIYASACRQKEENIICMIALEMLGYYSRQKNSQQTPFTTSRKKYPHRADFIAVIGNQASQQIALQITHYLQQSPLIKTETYIPASYSAEIELSDHASFWKQNYPAVMITDTAFYRNPNYHEPTDTIATLNFRYFTRVVFSLSQALIQLDQQGLT